MRIGIVKWKAGCLWAAAPGLLLLLLPVGLTGQDAGDREQIEWRALSQAQREAAEQGKKVLVYFYTEWCAQCDRIEARVFPKEAVARSLNEMFFSVKLNAGSRERVRFAGGEYTKEQFARAMGVRGVPAFLFMGPNGEIIRLQVGYTDERRFLKLLHWVGTGAHEHIAFEDYSMGG